MDTSDCGIVISLHARKCTVVSETDGREITCLLRGRHFEKLKGDRKPVAVGDRVSFRITSEGAALEKIHPRRNALTRPIGSRQDEMQTIAANIDRMVNVTSLKDPPLRWGLIDRFLVAAGVEEIDEVLICLNKADLADSREDEELLETTRKLYQGLGYPFLITSALDGRGVDRLKEALGQGVSLIVGHSGVGKSTLINRIDPSLRLKTGSISEKQRKGRHTTSRVSLLKLSTGGFVVDTPGIREFGIQGIRPGDLGHFFPEMADRLRECQYPNCTHRHEPGCAVKTALEGGEIVQARYDSYLRLLDTLE